jgi:hypothetical protein
MAEQHVYDAGTPTIEVRIYQDGTLVGTELCEDEQEAAEAVAAWEDQDGVAVVDDLTQQEDPEDALAVDVASEDGEG